MSTVAVSEVLERLVHHRLLLIPFGHVAAFGGTRSAPQGFGERVQPIGRTRGEHEAVAGLGNVASGCGADAARCAGDEDDGLGRVRIIQCTIVPAST
jgi:hypothetical protein